jgi:predicted TIM-barrel fold metal-dependent hydrolase
MAAQAAALSGDPNSERRFSEPEFDRFWAEAVELRNQPGAKNIMWSSDYPHSETTFPDSLKVIDRDFAGVPEAERRVIICERARQLFKVGQ